MLITQPPISRRVLIAEDDNTIKNMLTMGLEKENYVPVTVSNGGEAYRLLRQDSNFCGAIFDMRTQNVEGIDVVEFMRTEKRLMRIPIMMIAADSDFRFMTKGFAAGVSVFLAKPFTLHNLQSTLRLLLRTNARKQL